MQDESFWSDVWSSLRDRAPLAFRGQYQTEQILGPLVGNLDDFLDYPPVFVSRPLKSRKRLHEKAAELRHRDPNLAPDAAVSGIRDLAGGRVLVVGLEDLWVVHRLLREQVATSPNLRFDGDVKDFVNTPTEAGFRGLIQQLELTTSDEMQFDYELQILTLMQHAWAQLEHRMYESARVGDSVDDEIAAKFRELSDRLHQMDQEIDDARRHWLAGS